MLSRLAVLILSSALLLTACTGTPGPKGDTGAIGPAGTTGAPGPGFTGTVFSDWRAAVQNNGTQFSPDKNCGYFGILDNINELLEAKYKNGIILMYVQASDQALVKQYLVPGQLAPDTGISQVATNNNYIVMTMEIKSKSFLTFADCPKPSQQFAAVKFRYVLIPVPAATPGAALSASSLHSNLEKARAWYGLNDLSYASVTRRFGLHN